MKESNLFKKLAATFVVIVLGGPAVVLADAPSHIEDVKVTVSYADLNLENEEGLQELYQRLQYASREVCYVASPRKTESFIMKYSQLREARRCYRETLSDAVVKFDNEDLIRIHAG